MEILISLLIFFARVTDVSMGTMRIIFVSRDARIRACLLGFFEVLIWLVALGYIMRNLDNVYNYIAYAAGFGMGNFVGISIERKLSLGHQIIRIITKKDPNELIGFLKEKGYRVTVVNAKGATGDVKILFTILKRRTAKHMISVIEKFNPKAFYTIEDIRFVTDADFLSTGDFSRRRFGRLNSLFQKMK